MPITKTFNQNPNDDSDPQPLNNDLNVIITQTNTNTTQITSIQSQMTGYTDTLNSHAANTTDAHGIDDKVDTSDYNVHILNATTAHGLNTLISDTNDNFYQIGVSVKKKGATGDGTTNDYTTINDALTEASTGNYSVIYFPAGTYRIGNNITFPSTVTLKFANRAIISVDTGITVTINSYIDAGIYQIFSGDGTIAGSMQNLVIYPQWWGAIPTHTRTAVTDQSAAIQKAVTYCCSSNVKNLYFSQGFYGVLATILITDNINITGVYNGRYGISSSLGASVLVALTGNNDPVIKFFKTGDVIYGSCMKDICILGSDHFNTSANAVDRTAIHIEDLVSENHFERINISGFLRHGIYGAGWMDGYIRGVRLQYCGTDNVYPALYLTDSLLDHCNALTFYGFHWEYCKYVLNVDGYGGPIKFIGYKIDFNIAVPAYVPVRIGVNVALVEFTAGEINNKSATNTTYYTTPADQPYFMKIDNWKTIIIGNRFSSDTNTGAKWIQHTGTSVIITNNLFYYCYAGEYSFILGDYAIFKDNVLSLNMTTDNKKYFMEMGNECRVKTNIIRCGAEAPSEGYIFNATGTGNQIIDNKVWNNSFYKYFNGSVNNNCTAGTPNFGTFTNGDTTPSVMRLVNFKTANTSPTNITTFDDGLNGQEIKIVAGDNNTTLVHGVTLVLAKGSNYTMTTNKLLKFTYDGTTWLEHVVSS